MAEFLAIIKLFLKLYPMLKEIIELAGDKALEFQISADKKRIEAIFKDENKGPKTKASNLNDIFRK